MRTQNIQGIYPFTCRQRANGSWRYRSQLSGMRWWFGTPQRVATQYSDVMAWDEPTAAIERVRS